MATPRTERSYHRFKASGQQFEVETKFSFIRPIGHGAYGVVISALNKSTNQKVAIKKITRAFDDPVDAKRILREIKLMKKLYHENVIRIVDLIPPPPSQEEFEDIYIVQDLMETDLHRIIYSKQPLTIDHVQYFVYQILRGLKYIHSSNVLHRDLKPSNLLVNANCDLKICDFGLARGVEDEQSGALTEYVVTRWYRAPEIMLACHDYTKSIDVWSVGCIFAELLARQALFPGEDYIAQLRLICDKMGRPSEDDLNFVTSDRAKRFILSLPLKSGTPMGELFPAHTGETDAHDLLKKMLDFHPDKRISITDALAHPFMASLHNPDDEPSADFTFDFDFEDEELSRERVQALIWDEIREVHNDIAETHPTATPRRTARRPSANALFEAKAEAKNDSEDDNRGEDEKASRKRTASNSSVSPDKK